MFGHKGRSQRLAQDYNDPDPKGRAVMTKKSVGHAKTDLVFRMCVLLWLVVELTHLKNMSQIGNLPQIVNRGEN